MYYTHSYPLLNIPMPGTIPTKIIVPHTGDGAAAPVSAAEWFDQHHQSAKTPVEHEPPVPGRHLFNFSFESPPFPWARTEPFIYVQQVVLRSQVVPWHTGDMRLTDAYRGPLHEIFKLLETVSNHEHTETQTTLPRLCLHVENVKRREKATVFPEYNCLVLSPANFWQQSVHTFNKDVSLLATIFQHHVSVSLSHLQRNGYVQVFLNIFLALQNIQKSKVSTAEMLFGMQLRDTGIKRYPIRVRPRVIQYAITLVLRHNDQAFLASLRDKLTRMYPLHQLETPTAGKTATAADTEDATDSNLGLDVAQQLHQQAPTSIMYVYYPGEFNWLEFTPLAIAFVMLFAYVYFSIRKIDEIRSRALLATCAVITVFSSLMMSLGLCFFFDLTTRMQSKGVFQYLIILLGLENVLVITKSVISTDHTFDVKIRVAQGLSREGWTISKTLLTEITILTIGLATFVPVIQEFCVFAIVGLMCDFFLQMMLFSTVLAMDIKRVDVGDLRRVSPNSPADAHSRRMPFRNSTITPSMTINRSRSHPKLTALDSLGAGGSGCGDIGASGCGIGSNGRHAAGRMGNGCGAQAMRGGGSKSDAEIPKRLRFVNFWARTRFFQRAFMLWMIVWIGSIIYNTRVLEQLFVLDTTGDSNHSDATHATDVPAMVSSFLLNNESGTAGAVPVSDSGDDAQPFIRSRHQPPQVVSPVPPTTTNNGGGPEEPFNITEQMHKLHHPEYDTHYYLSNFHWSAILRQYNVSLSGRYVAVLPPIKLAHVVPAAEAIKMRNPDERQQQHFQWKALAVALDPIDFADLDAGDGDGGLAALAAVGGAAGVSLIGGGAQKMAGHGHLTHQRPPPLLHGSTPLIPKSPMEILMVAILCAISVSVLTYTMVVFYRCICTRNYAEWRSSWTDTDRIPPRRQQQRILEGVPILVRGHTHRIECLVTDGQVVASSCLDGQVKMWDTNNGELIASIDRNRFFQMSRQLFASPQQSHHQQQLAQRSFDAAIHMPTTSSKTTDQQLVQLAPAAAATAAPPTPGSRCAFSPIWCLDYLDNLIVIGCADGRLEFWEASTGNLKCVYESEPPAQPKGGITHLHLAGNRVVATRLSGRIDFLRLESYTQGRHIDWGFTAAYRRSKSC